MALPKGKKKSVPITLAVLAVGGGYYMFSEPAHQDVKPPAAISSPIESPADFRRGKLRTAIKTIVLDGSVLSIKRGISDYEARISVGKDWHDLAYDIRLGMGRQIWKKWSQSFPPHARDRARIVIVNEKGRKVGGSRMLGAFDIWVRK
ncbi:MAG: hypothetical protein HOM28_10975 [Rhodospirillales bacterium]|nr:hypothetical protein [Rhodospirillales bacterium]